MRQKKAVRVIVIVAVVLVAALVGFGLVRSGGEHEHHEPGEHQHEPAATSEDEHQHEPAAASEGEHQHEPAVASEGEGHHEHAEEHPESGVALIGLSPSGTVVEGVRVIEIRARRFEFDPPTIVVIHGETVRLRLTSEDVTHGIGILDYDIEAKLEPGETKEITFTAGSPGRHHFHCSTYCGEGHAEMHGELIVLESRE